MGGGIINNFENKKLKKLFLIYGITILSIIYFYNINIKDDSLSDKELKNGAFAKYSKGFVYIGDKEFLDNLDNIDKNDVLIQDERNSTNPSMKIRDSYLITDSNLRKEILEILCEYEKKYPSNWDRTIETMDLEWEAHNILYYLNYKKDHTTDVDLDNNDETKYAKVLK